RKMEATLKKWEKEHDAELDQKDEKHAAAIERCENTIAELREKNEVREERIRTQGYEQGKAEAREEYADMAKQLRAFKAEEKKRADVAGRLKHKELGALLREQTRMSLIEDVHGAGHSGDYRQRVMIGENEAGRVCWEGKGGDSMLDLAKWVRKLREDMSV